MPKFKEGDVVQLEHDNMWCIDAIIGPQVWANIPNQVGICALREPSSMHDPDWSLLYGAWELDRSRPHPEADRVWVDYCAWRLTNASAT